MNLIVAYVLKEALSDRSKIQLNESGRIPIFSLNISLDELKRLHERTTWSIVSGTLHTGQSGEILGSRLCNLELVGKDLVRKRDSRTSNFLLGGRSRCLAVTDDKWLKDEEYLLLFQKLRPSLKEITFKDRDISSSETSSRITLSGPI